jgi:predicted MPP superfamily phosphohydrolase
MIIAAAALLLFVLFCAWQNGHIGVTHIGYASRFVPPELDGLTVAHISDLHNRRFAGGPERLAGIIRAQSPDIIAATGDFIDKRRPDIGAAIAFIRLAADIAPVYFVSGNHEHRSGQYDSLLPRLEQAGVHVLDDTSAVIEKNGRSFIIAGLRDPAFFSDRSGKTDDRILRERKETLHCLKALEGLLPDGPSLFLLLSHRPELFRMYAECGVTLALTGHAHGGQVRLPGVGGLLAPGQGFFPKYTSGLHRRGDTAMVVSRGLGGRFCRLRIFNRPEVVVVRMKPYLMKGPREFQPM